MLRSPILFLSDAKWARRLVKDWGLARRVARQFVAGESLSEALEVSRTLGERGLATSLAHLGEHVTSESEAASSRDEIRGLIKVTMISYLDPARSFANFGRLLCY